MLMKTNLLCPIRNFAPMGHLIYRGAQPEYSYEYNYLKNKGVKHIINLRSESDHDKRYGTQFNVHTIPVDDHKIPTDENVKRFVQLVRNNEGIFFHCEHGRGRTSLFAVILRLSEGWTLEKALNEEKQVFGYSFQHPVQIEYLKNFNHKLLQ